MKEAAGEANMTVVTIVLIAAVVAIATPIITSTVRQIGKRNCCNAAGGQWNSNECKSVNADGSLGDKMTDPWEEQAGKIVCK